MINELDNSKVVDGNIYFNEDKYLDLGQINSVYPTLSPLRCTRIGTRCTLLSLYATEEHGD